MPKAFESGLATLKSQLTSSAVHVKVLVGKGDHKNFGAVSLEESI